MKSNEIKFEALFWTPLMKSAVYDCIEYAN